MYIFKEQCMQYKELDLENWKIGLSFLGIYPLVIPRLVKYTQNFHLLYLQTWTDGRQHRITLHFNNTQMNEWENMFLKIMIYKKKF